MLLAWLTSTTGSCAGMPHVVLFGPHAVMVFGITPGLLGVPAKGTNTQGNSAPKERFRCVSTTVLGVTEPGSQCDTAREGINHLQ